MVSSLPPGGKFPGTEAFTLYTTYGFPLDLTELMAEEEGRQVDAEEFKQKSAMQFLIFVLHPYIITRTERGVHRLYYCCRPQPMRFA